MRDTIFKLWDRATACLGEHASSLRVRDGASEAAIVELEAALGEAGSDVLLLAGAQGRVG
jgi:hypothetical protein